MTALQLALLVVCVVGIAAGQILFKLGAVTFAGKSFLQMMSGLLVSPLILSGFVVYGVSTILWIGLLRYIPLSRAYPFMAFAFALVPLASWAFLGERVDSRYFAGATLILLGLILISK